jgi:hypothetical protein
MMTSVQTSTYQLKRQSLGEKYSSSSSEKEILNLAAMLVKPSLEI